MSLIRFGTAMIVAATLVGCSSDSTDNNNTGGTQGGTCTATLTGAVVATVPCVVGAAFSSGSGIAALSITGGTAPTFTFGISQTGDFAAGMITASTAGITGASSVTSGAGLWLVQTTGTPIGGFNLTFSSATAGTGSTTGHVTVVHGTLDVNLSPQTATGASGAVAAHVIF